MPVAEIEFTESQLQPVGSSLHQGYQGKKYKVCDIRNPGGGCDFFKWDHDKWASRDPQSQLCDCHLVPITVKVPLKEPKNKENKNKKPRLDSKRFQVCPKGVCGFFRWLDSGQNSPCKTATKYFFGTYCSKHFLLKDHIANQEEQNSWWEKNSREYKENNNPAPDLSCSLTNLAVTSTDPLTLRILTVASMAFTQIPRLLSQHSPDSVLILMR